MSFLNPERPDWAGALLPPAYYCTIASGQNPGSTMDEAAFDALTLALNDAGLTKAELDNIHGEIDRELSAYRRYPAGWDGYDGSLFDNALIDQASSIAAILVSQFRRARAVPSELEPGPASDGSIDIECACSDKSLLITIYPDEGDQVRWSWRTPTQHQQGENRIEDLPVECWVSWLLGETDPPMQMDQDPGDTGRPDSLASSMQSLSGEEEDRRDQT